MTTSGGTGGIVTRAIDRAGALQILLVEDDSGDALLVQELLGESEVGFKARWARTIAEAEPILGQGVDCVLLDLGLPDATGLEGLARILELSPGVAVVVLTGLADLGATAEAMAAGAQDYLYKGEIDEAVLSRSIRYAIERRRADESARRLFEARIHEEQNARLERRLLPLPLIRDPSLAWASAYRPCRVRTLVGGDFFDAIERPDGSLRIVVGDVAGHGPDEAALGVAMRIAWRTLVLSGLPEALVLPALEEVLLSERPSAETFTTVCDLVVAPDRASVLVRLAGHPAPLRLEPTPTPLVGSAGGPPLGVLPGYDWPGTEVELVPSWSLLLFTDGLIERRGDSAAGQWGMERLLQSASGFRESGLDPDAFVERLLTRICGQDGDPPEDDIAVFLLASRGAGA